MMRKVIEDAVRRADFVLVGIGEEFASDIKLLYKIPKYQDILDKIEQDKEKYGWLIPFLFKTYLDKHEDNAVHSAYQALSLLLQGKNYFILTENMDGKIFHSYFDEERIVAPCGNYAYLQCEEDCCGQILSVEDAAGEVLDFFRDKNEVLWEEFDGITEPVCEFCGKRLVFNNIEALSYQESVYLPMWNKYMKWLQGTLNRKLCILELGVGFRYPTMIRWPFEKAAFLNQKADFIRIHHSLYQLSEELKEKGISISENAVDFLRNTFVQ